MSNRRFVLLMVIFAVAAIVLAIAFILFAAQAAAGQEFGREVQFLPLVANGLPGVRTPTPFWMMLPTMAPTMDPFYNPVPYPTPNPTPTPGGE